MKISSHLETKTERRIFSDCSVACNVVALQGELKVSTINAIVQNWMDNAFDAKIDVSFVNQYAMVATLILAYRDRIVG